MRRSLLVVAIAMATIGSIPVAAAQAASATLELQQAVPLPGVEGRIDHLDLDSARQRLFICALGNNSVEAVDLRKGETIHSIGGLGAPQGLASVPGLSRLFIANDKGGLCQFYDAKSWQLLSSVGFEDDADNVRYDAAANQIYVGFGAGGIGVVSASDGKRVSSIKLAAHPEAFVLEKQGRRIFVNVPNAGQVAVIDRDKGEVVAAWKTSAASANFPIAIDEASHRLFVGCRAPAKLVVLNTDTGATVASLDISGDTDEVFYDAKRHHLYAICGEGFIDVIQQDDADHYKRSERISTASGARTGFFDSEGDNLFVAVPHRGAQRAEIRRYRIRRL